MTGQHGIGFYVEHEVRRRPFFPENGISLGRQCVVGGIDFYGVKMLCVESKSAFRGIDLPGVEGAAFDQGLVGPGSRAHSYFFHL